MRYDVPAQDLEVSLSRMPVIPESRFVVANVSAEQMPEALANPHLFDRWSSGGAMRIKRSEASTTGGPAGPLALGSTSLVLAQATAFPARELHGELLQESAKPSTAPYYMSTGPWFDAD